MTSRLVLLGLGSNTADRSTMMRRALRELGSGRHPFRLIAWSGGYQSDALLPDGAPASWNQPYLNLAALIETAAEPAAVLGAVKAIERRLGRIPAERWSPRPIDIDLLADERFSFATETLSLPHRDLVARPFALLPAADLAPAWPISANGTGTTLGRLAAAWRVPGAAPLDTRRVPVVLTDLVGILNLTPDSFSDGGQWTDAGAAIDHASRLAEAGATVIDLGAESTRPGAAAVGAEEEWRRLAPVLTALRNRWPAGGGPMLSVDTRHAVTAERAVGAGADWINDVTGLTDPAMIGAVRASSADLVVMHSLGVPPGPARLDPGSDPVDQLLAWGHDTLDRLGACGIDRGRVIIDPGIGFGKTADQTRVILAEIDRLRALGVRVLVGHSRKSFLGHWFPDLAGPAGDRDPESAALSQHLASAGADYLRIHDVVGTARAVRVGSLLGTSGVRPGRLGEIGIAGR